MAQVPLKFCLGTEKLASGNGRLIQGERGPKFEMELCKMLERRDMLNKRRDKCCPLKRTLPRQSKRERERERERESERERA